MQLADLSSIDGGYAHVYLSPHLDDAALSCGGLIAAQAAAGEPVLVVTFCTAAPPPGGPFSALAEEFHREWGLAPAEAVAARLREDRGAIELLGADSLWAGMLDAIYRHPAAYDRRETLFAAPAADDPLLPALRAYLGGLRERLAGATFYAPLGVGSHVDHLITFRAATECAGPDLALYEDFPYVARLGELERRLAALGGEPRQRAAAIDATLGRKIAAIEAYASQLAELARSQLGRQVSDAEAAGVMAAAVAGYARRVAPPGAEFGERVWLL